MDSDKNQTQLNQTVSEQTSSKPYIDKPHDRNQADGKRDDRKIPGSYAQIMSVAKLGLKNRLSGFELQRRRATILRELEEARRLLVELRSRLKEPSEFDERDLSEYRQILEARERDLKAKLTPSEAEEDKDHEYEDLIYEDCDDEDSGDDEGVPLGLEVLSESLHEDGCSSADDMEANEETNSDLNANSGEDSDSDTEINMFKGKGVKVEQFLDEECF
ncbi:hypothetical protein LCI18_003606 [Fusarium solani-melongenae]|uniref:Uncharacterized protein n=1 Tax=Fusarium solani subsp. cucurbitae TaxID=2747967 RepID=A0ACD3YUU9_FUSSC|nr:hypothetical protein LCI18_003606 [Fusarium solani-melongenae]